MYYNVLQMLRGIMNNPTLNAEILRNTTQVRCRVVCHPARGKIRYDWNTSVSVNVQWLQVTTVK
jgi:hypothetical protein